MQHHWHRHQRGYPEATFTWQVPRLRPGVELGTMRGAADARVMTSSAGRARYARGLVAGVRAFLG